MNAAFSTSIFSRFFAAAAIAVLAAPAMAQILPREDESSGFEDIYDQQEAADNQAAEKRRKRQRQEEKREAKDLERLSQLGELQPFQDISVIQRRFLPKSSRFELSGSGLISTNNAFFNNFGLSVRGAFYINEKFGIEGIYNFQGSAERPITKNLVDKQRIDTRALVEPEAFYGAVLKWSPIYGKMAWFQKKIIPFDIYFMPGFGVSKTALGTGETTFTLGFGQLFALSKSYGVRYDFVWNYYQAEVQIDGERQKNNHSDLLLSIGLSYFIPEATYR